MKTKLIKTIIIAVTAVSTLNARTPRLNPEIGFGSTINGSGFGLQHQINASVIYNNHFRVGYGTMMNSERKINGWNGEVQYIAVNFHESYSGNMQLYFKAGLVNLKNVPLSKTRATYEQLSAKNISGLTDYNFTDARYNVVQTSLSSGLEFKFLKRMALFGEIGANYHRLTCCNFDNIELAQRDRSLTLQLSGGIRISCFTR